jgi:hypothetical protein
MSFENPIYARILLFGLVAAGLWGFLLYLLRRARSPWAWAARLPFIVLLGLSLALAAHAWWFNNRRQPRPLKRGLYPGLTYERAVGRLGDGAPYVAHIAEFSLDQYRLGIAAVPRDRGQLAAALPSHLLREDSRARLLINGDFYGPWKDRGPQDYEPHIGDAVDTSTPCIHRGTQISKGANDARPDALLYVVKGGNRPEISTRREMTRAWEELDLAVGGIGPLVGNGAVLPPKGTVIFHGRRHPRSVIALDRQARKVTFIVIDGRQPGYSAGMTWRETAEFAITRGAHGALMLDGGGSSALVLREENGRPRVLNWPIHNTIPGRERPIANAVVVYPVE